MTVGHGVWRRTPSTKRVNVSLCPDEPWLTGRDLLRPRPDGLQPVLWPGSTHFPRQVGPRMVHYHF
jgi:hypothetical protein